MPNALDWTSLGLPQDFREDDRVKLSHSGIYGCSVNEKADELANRGASTPYFGTESSLGLPQCSVTAQPVLLAVEKLSQGRCLRIISDC